MRLVNFLTGKEDVYPEPVMDAGSVWPGYNYNFVSVEYIQTAGTAEYYGGTADPRWRAHGASFGPEAWASAGHGVSRCDYCGRRYSPAVNNRDQVISECAGCGAPL